MSTFSERCERIETLRCQIKPLRTSTLGWENFYLDEAVRCYCHQLYIACIVVSSALLETCLFMECFKLGIIGKKGTVLSQRLSKSDFIKAGSLTRLIGTLSKTIEKRGIPLELILHDDEDLDRPNRLRYIKRRNKFHHGEGFHPIANPSDFLPSNQNEIKRYNLDNIEGIDITQILFEKMAYIHLSKTLEFLKKFSDIGFLPYF